MELYQKLPEALLPWYEENKRDLPWRQDKEPYHIWLSEIMLQQTRVEAVKGYYARFLAALPTVGHLAQCEDEQLFKLWEGLGYYSRVRNLKKAAVVIEQEHGGVFPHEYHQILALPGIGEYTAGAVASIAFDLPVAAVDGNVLRVISRITNDPTPIDSAQYKRLVRKNLETVYPKSAGDFTQALMELGATLCGPNWKPRCGECPCREFCQGYRMGTAEQLPGKQPKKEKRVEEKTVLILSCDGRYALQKRPDTGLLAGLWQFPDLSGKLQMNAVMEKVEGYGLHTRQIIRQVEKKHIFTHVIWDMCGVYLEVAAPDGPFTWMTEEQIEKTAALPTAYRQFWEDKIDV